MIPGAMKTDLAELLPGDIRAAIGLGKKVVFVSGNFNIIHPGHLRLLKFASEAGDAVVVGVHPDTNPGVTVPAKLRLEGLIANSHIDYAFVMKQPISDVLSILRPDIVVKGKEFENRDNPECPIVQSYGGKIYFGSGEVRFSSLNLLRREYFETRHSEISKPHELPTRRGFKIGELKDIVKLFSEKRLVVIGDLIIDNYIDCEPLGMSQEDPTIVVSPIEQRTFVGGAGIVALHARGLGAKVNFVTVTGDDDHARYALRTLTEHGITVEAIADPTRPTTCKTRYRAGGKSLLRVNELRQHAIEQSIGAKVIAAVERFLPHTDVLLFSDFNYGCLPQGIVETIAESAAAYGVLMAADSQASSQVSDISRYRDMMLITPTEREVRLAMRDFDSGLISVVERLKSTSNAKNILVTLGAEGMLIYADHAGKTHTDRLPAFNSSPRDPAGAGDSLFATVSLALSCGVDIWRSSYLGSLAAACQVSRVGNLPLAAQEIIDEIDFPDLMTS